MILIAEVKTKSPFGFASSKTWDELFEFANTYGDWLSIHTNPLWGGSFELLEKARKLTAKIILAKGIHASDEDVERAVKIGADFVLVVGRIPKVHLSKCLIEVNSLEELKKITPDLKVVWNSRDLKNGRLKVETFEDARKNFKGWMCQASNISKISDVKIDADAILVGEKLEEYIKSINK